VVVHDHNRTRISLLQVLVLRNCQHTLSHGANGGELLALAKAVHPLLIYLVELAESVASFANDLTLVLPSSIGVQCGAARASTHKTRSVAFRTQVLAGKEDGKCRANERNRDGADDEVLRAVR